MNSRVDVIRKNSEAVRFKFRYLLSLYNNGFSFFSTDFSEY